jgi:hypothetical protein
VGADLFGLARTDVADLPVLVIVPALPGNGVGDRFAQFVRAGGGQRIELGQPSGQFYGLLFVDTSREGLSAASPFGQLNLACVRATIFLGILLF